MSDNPVDLRMYFAFFNEIGIIEQLSRTSFEHVLPKGVLVSHFTVINHLVRLGDGRTPLQIATAFQVPKTTMSHTLALVEKRGWIEMRPNPADKRSKCVWLTENGRQFREDAIAALAPIMAAMAQEFESAEIADLVPRLAKVRAYLDEARNSDG